MTLCIPLFYKIDLFDFFDLYIGFSLQLTAKIYIDT